MKKRFDSTDIINVESLKHSLVQRRSTSPTLTILVNELLGKVIVLRPAEEIRIGRDLECDISLDLSGLSRQHCAVFRQGNRVYVKDLDSTNGTFVNGERIQVRQLSDGDRIFLGDICVCKFAYTDQIDLDINRMLFDKATRDPLTGLYNRTYFQESLRKEFLFHDRTELPLSLVFMDLDDFKKINDRYGHACGDLVLKDVAFILRQELREIDFLSRYGGEEFVIMMKNTPADPAASKIEALRARLASHDFQFGATTLHVTASFGLATLSEGRYRTPQELLTAADAAMYRAKQQGKNRVISYENEPHS